MRSGDMIVVPELERDLFLELKTGELQWGAHVRETTGQSERIAPVVRSHPEAGDVRECHLRPLDSVVTK